VLDFQRFYGGAGQGVGLGGALLSYVFCKMARNTKATPKPHQRLHQKTKYYSINGLVVCFGVFGVIEICIEKMGW